jgi:hypothetical protein
VISTAQRGIIKNSLTAEVGAPQLAGINQGIIGASGILKLYGDLACTKVNDNTVRLADGMYSLSGYALGVDRGTTEDLTIDSGTAGQNRNDIVAAEFIRNGGGAGIDTLHFVVVKGTSTSGTAADPTLTQQDINGSGTTRQEAVWRVKLAGTTITTVERVASLLTNVYNLSAAVSAMQPDALNATGAMSDLVNALIDRWGTYGNGVRPVTGTLAGQYYYYAMTNKISDSIGYIIIYPGNSKTPVICSNGGSGWSTLA